MTSSQCPPGLFRFGDLEALLGQLHEILPEKRIAFHGRLNNLLRLGMPAKLKRGRGYPALYSAGDVVHMAFLVELTRMGLTPERAAQLLATDEFAMFAAVQRSVELLQGGVRAGDPIIVYFAPNNLRPLSRQEEGRGLLWGDAVDIAIPLATATMLPSSRALCLFNVTTFLDALTSLLSSDGRRSFLAEVAHWSASARRSPVVHREEGMGD